MWGNKEVVQVHGPYCTMEDSILCKCCPGGADVARLTDRCCAASVRTLTWNNKRARRQVFVVAVSPPEMRHRNGSGSHRLRGGSGASCMTGGTTSESDFDGPSSLLHGYYTSNSPASLPSAHSTDIPSAGSRHYGQSSSGTSSTFSVPSPSFSVTSGIPTTQNTLSPIATRMLERDADTMEKYKQGNRSGSAGTTSMDTPSQTNSIRHLNAVDREEVVPPMNSLVLPRLMS